jgi:asparagine N-glycosylation enzyme membrane subunit Stt3
MAHIPANTVLAYKVERPRAVGLRIWEIEVIQVANSWSGVSLLISSKDRDNWMAHFFQ